MADLFSPLSLPNGTQLKSRICKAAMEENMADYGQVPSEGLITLYETWAKGGAGLILSGNVMISPTALTGPGGVVLEKGTLDDAPTRELFERWAKAGKAGGTQFWLQISHPGRQVYASQGTEAVSASATKVEMEGASKMFATARALSGDEIKALITRFADTAEAAEQAGFDGVELHAAHGYLVAQFLSPLTNLREDEWGGSLENRARFLLESVKAVRARVSPGFGVGVKLNSADFQRGGFDVDDARRVTEWLGCEHLDLLELSGGSYESAAMMGIPADERFEPSSTEKREMYFVGFAKEIAAGAEMPIMCTGGVTRRETAQSALDSGAVDVIGIARAFGFAPNLAKDWQADQNLNIDVNFGSFKNPLLNTLAAMSMTKSQLHRMGAGKSPTTKQNVILAIIKDRMRIAKITKRYKKWLAAKG